MALPTFQPLARILEQAASQCCSLSAATYLHLQKLGKAPNSTPGQKKRYRASASLRRLLKVQVEPAGAAEPRLLSRDRIRQLVGRPDALGLSLPDALAALLTCYPADEALRCLLTLRLSSSRIRELASEEHGHPVTDAQFKRFEEWGLLPAPYTSADFERDRAQIAKSRGVPLDQLDPQDKEVRKLAEQVGLYPLSTLGVLLTALRCPIKDMPRRTLCLRLAWERFPVPGAIVRKAMLSLTASADSFRGHKEKAEQLLQLLAPEPNPEGQPNYLALMLREEQALLSGWHFPPFGEWHGVLSGEGDYHTDDGDGAHVGISLANLDCPKCEQRWLDCFDSRVGFWYTGILNLRHVGRLIDGRFGESREGAADIPIEQTVTILAVRDLSQYLYRRQRAREFERAGRLSPLGHVLPEPTANKQEEPVRAVPF